MYPRSLLLRWLLYYCWSTSTTVHYSYVDQHLPTIAVGAPLLACAHAPCTVIGWRKGWEEHICGVPPCRWGLRWWLQAFLTAGSISAPSRTPGKTPCQVWMPLPKGKWRNIRATRVAKCMAHHCLHAVISANLGVALQCVVGFTCHLSLKQCKHSGYAPNRWRTKYGAVGGPRSASLPHPPPPTSLYRLQWSTSTCTCVAAAPPGLLLASALHTGNVEQGHDV